MLEVPDYVTIISDGDIGEWNWFDPEFIITMEEWRDEADGELPTVMTWTSPP